MSVKSIGYKNNQIKFIPLLFCKNFILYLLSYKQTITSMSTNLTAIRSHSTISKSIILDTVALAFIYFLPALSHIGNYPLYLIEPMRIMLILAIMYSSKRNAYIIAFTLPMFSFLLTHQPVFYKTIIMTIELVLNIWLFYFLSNKFKNYFAAIFTSILASKAVYFGLLYGLVNLQLLESNLISTPIYFQFILAMVLSSVLFIVLTRRESKPFTYADPTKEEF
jgi:hypothetical protein